MGFTSGQNQSEEGLNEINITPFVDVVLVLLVIFMVTAPAMIKESLKVKLPKSLSSDLVGEGEQVALAITKEGQVLLNGQVLGDEALQKRLSEFKKTTRFMVSADADSKHQSLIRVIDLLKRSKLERFALQVERVDRPGGFVGESGEGDEGAVNAEESAETSPAETSPAQ